MRGLDKKNECLAEQSLQSKNKTGSRGILLCQKVQSRCICFWYLCIYVSITKSGARSSESVVRGEKDSADLA